MQFTLRDFSILGPWLTRSQILQLVRKLTRLFSSFVFGIIDHPREQDGIIDFNFNSLTNN